MKIVQECPDCRGAGLYSGFFEPKGEAVICCGCDGQGWVKHYFRPFDGRKKKAGIKSIKKSRGSFIATGVGGVGDAMSYAQFEKLYPVKLPKE